LTKTLKVFRPTKKQREAITLLKSSATNILLYGGTRSGKTALFIESIIYRALNYANSRHLIARLRYNHAKTSVWHETLLPALKRLPKHAYTINKTDLYITLANGSEIWVGGFDDKDRVEKILGHEYCTVFFNEISQISYETILLGLSRLAQKINGCKNKAYYDCNPPSPLHWAYKQFILKQNPKTGEILKRQELFASLLMNPVHNLDNLPENYIEDFLEILPENARRRFLLGEWVKREGVIYGKFADKHIVKRKEVPQIEYYAIGLDFGLNSCAVLIGFVGEGVYILDEVSGYNITASVLNKKMLDKWSDIDYIVYCDPNGGERIQEINNGYKADNAVEDGIDTINTLIERDDFYIVDTCRNVLDEIISYRRDEKERVVKENDHHMDAMRYGIFSALPQKMGGITWV
jgi:PBSX family phage terminase large subunit